MNDSPSLYIFQALYFTLISEVPPTPPELAQDACVLAVRAMEAGNFSQDHS